MSCTSEKYIHKIGKVNPVFEKYKKKSFEILLYYQLASFCKFAHTNNDFLLLQSVHGQKTNMQGVSKCS